MAKKVRLCNHNGRTGKNGVFNVSHNDRTATRADEKDKHINDEMSKMNVYWTWNGEPNFKKAEKQFYEKSYGETIEKRNKRYMSQGHKERCTSIDKLLQSPQTAPQETILQIGDREHMQALIKYFGDEIKARQAMGEILLNAFKKYRQKIENENVHILTMALHLDEPDGMCHIHCRTVFDYVNAKEERTLSQNKALESIGVEPPDPEKPLGRFNNRKQIYDTKTRAWWIESVKTALDSFKDRHEAHKKVSMYLCNFELEPEKGRKHRMEKNDYILAEQEKQIAKNKKNIQYQDAFLEFVKAAEEEEIERQRQLARQKGR